VNFVKTTSKRLQFVNNSEAYINTVISLPKSTCNSLAFSFYYYYYFSLLSTSTRFKMARFFHSIIALVLVAFVIMNSIEAKPFTDGMTSGTILSPYGGALSTGFGPSFNNFAAYNPYSGLGFYGRK
jgi:high-affinity Fe2+/Pb2+ permease